MDDPYPELPKIGRMIYPPLGYCMYCDRKEDLTSEHIIPFALGGDIELPASSCKECAKITSRFERKLLRGQLWPARIALGIRSRRKHREAPTHTAIEIEVNGKRSRELISREAAPAVITFPVFASPRLALGESSPGVTVVETVTISYGKDPKEIATELGVSAISFTDKTNPYQFAQLLAKIALGMAIAVDRISMLTEPSPLPGVILGIDPRIGDYVGSMNEELKGFPGLLHRVAIFVDEKTGYLVADIQLFSESLSPRYAVIIGKTNIAT